MPSLNIGAMTRSDARLKPAMRHFGAHLHRAPASRTCIAHLHRAALHERDTQNGLV